MDQRSTEVHNGRGGSCDRRRSGVRSTAALLAALQLCTACYTYVPPRLSPSAGAQVSLDLTDEGRIAHSSALGPGVMRVVGVMKGMEGDRYVVDVSAVTPIRGQELPVSGVRVTLGPRHLTDLRVRTLSRKRSAWVIGIALATVVTFIITKGFKAGQTPPEGPPGGGGPDQ